MIIVTLNDAKKALVTLAIEQTLLEMGGNTLLDKVQSALFKEYHSYLPDCYEHPEYLNKVLKKIFGNAHTDIVKSIREELGDFADKGYISDFLEKIAE